MDVPLGRVAFFPHEPPAALRAHVAAMCGWEERWGAPVTRLELPTGRAVLIIGFGPGFEVDGTRLGAFVSGVFDRAAVVRGTGESAGVQVDLTALGARTLLGVPMPELTDLSVDIGDVLGPAGAELPARLAEAPDWPARFALADDTLLALLRAAVLPPPAVALAWARVVRSGGRVRVGELAREAGWSERQLARRFQDAVGLPPKAFARVVRFDRALRMLREGTPPAEVAAACGYADQPHLNREFRALAGLPPTALLTAELPGGAGVGFVQDGAPAPA